MEFLFYLFLFWIGWSLLLLFYICWSWCKKVVTGKETYFGPAEIKLIDDTLEDSDIAFKKIMFRGKIPVSQSMPVELSISAFDVTDDDHPKFIISLLEQQQEARNNLFWDFQ